MGELNGVLRLNADLFLHDNICTRVSDRTVKNFPLHWHDYFEIEVVLSGKGKHTLNGKDYAVSRGSAFLIRPTDFHQFSADEEIKILNITFNEKVLNEMYLVHLAYSKRCWVFDFDDETFERIQMTMKLLQEESGTVYEKQLLEYLLHFFIDEDSAAFNEERLGGVYKAIIYLDLHFRKDITLAKLAQRAGFTPTYFSEIFKKITGETYIHRLNHLRLEYACTLLSKGCSVSYACFESGFGSLSNFFTAFKKEYHISPRQFSQKAKNKS